jgi:hypothetical protein
MNLAERLHLGALQCHLWLGIKTEFSLFEKFISSGFESAHVQRSSGACGCSPAVG